MRRIANLVSVSCAVMLFGCGSSSDSEPGHDGGEGRSEAGDAGTAPTEPLPDQTAGKSCDVDEDCANGMCLTSLPGSFGGAATDAPDGYCSAACMANVDCGEGGVCSGALPSFGEGAATPGRCLKGCSGKDDCRESYRCVNGLGMMVMEGAMPDPISAALGPSACVPVPETVQLEDAVTGKPCAEDSDCGKGRCQKTDGMMTYPGGYCTGSCLQDAECGAGGSCTLPLVGTDAGSCYHSCQSNGDSDCREGYRCRTNGSRRQCLPGAAPLGDGVAGSACQTDADCGGAAMSCLTMVDGAPAPDGYCSQGCSENSDCGAGGTCVGGLGSAFSALIGATGVCYRTCIDSSSCRSGYECGQPAGAGGLGGMMASSSVCTASSAAQTEPSAAEEDAGVP